MSAALPPQRPRGWRRWVRAGWLLAALVAVVVALANQWDEISGHLDSLSPPWLVVSFVTAAAGALTSLATWRLAIGGLGHRLPWPAASRTYFVSQLAKYLPGGLWSILAQADIGRDYAVPVRVSVAAFAVFTWLVVAIGGAVSLLLLAVIGQVSWWLAPLCLVALALVVPSVLRRGLELALRLTRRAPLTVFPDRRAVALATLAVLGTWTLWGVHMWATAHAFGQEVSLPIATAAFVTAWLAGFLFLPAPAGAGVREAVLIGILLPALPPSASLTAALISRVVLTIIEVAFGLGSLATARAAAARAAASPDPAAPADDAATGPPRP